jgi:enoyl-[acyl-carrier protein] reductase I
MLKGKKGIISGALDESSIAWKVAERCHEEGAIFTLTNAPMAMRMGKINELGEKCNSKIIGADLTSVEDIENLYEDSLNELNGKVDFILHSVGMSPNVRKKKEYGDLNYEWLNKTLDVSAISFHKMLQVAEKKEVLNDWSSS